MNDILVGINYFAGWWEPLPNKWHRHGSSQDAEVGPDWRPDFPERVPLLGAFNTQDTMDRELAAAARFGVDFFPILWYYNEPGSEREPNARFLNNGLEHFVNSPNAGLMRFFIEFCNHPPFEVETDEQWQQCLDAWTAAFAHPSYLKIDGRPVFKIHGAQHFIDQNGGDLDRCRGQLASLRQVARDTIGADMCVGGGVMALDRITAEHPIARLFDFTCTYMDIPPQKQVPSNYPYEMLADLARAARQVHCHDAIAYMPYLPGGWCPRPWPDQRAFFDLPGRQQWALELERMKDDLLTLPNLGLPLPDGGILPAFNCYAWNEFGEGGILAPTRGDQYMKLEEIRKRF